MAPSSPSCLACARWAAAAVGPRAPARQIPKEEWLGGLGFRILGCRVYDFGVSGFSGLFFVCLGF